MSYYRPETLGDAIARVQDRALLAYAELLAPAYLTRSHIEKPKRPIDKHREHITLAAYLAVLSDLTGVNEHNVRDRLTELGLARRVLRREGLHQIESALSPGETYLQRVTQKYADEHPEEGDGK